MEHRTDPWNNGDLIEPTPQLSTPDSPPGVCRRCGGTGLWLTPMAIVAVCPNLQLRFNDHPSLSASAEMVLRAGTHLSRRGVGASPHCFDVARALTHFSTGDPCSRQHLIDKYFGWSKAGRLREFHKVIEQLRREWLLPVASRKDTPSGYWIAVTQADFADWFDRTSKAPKTQLQTIFRVAKANWPVYGEQLELDFWHDLAPEVPANFETAA